MIIESWSKMNNSGNHMYDIVHTGVYVEMLKKISGTNKMYINDY
jgi:hypothetical protein